MNFIDKIINLFQAESTPLSEAKANTPIAQSTTGGTYNHIWSTSYNGEKNLGEIGPIKNYALDYEALRLRSWQAYLESEVAQTIINKFGTWIIGKGLKLQADPDKGVLASEGINLESQTFSKLAEARFAIFGKSKKSDYSQMSNLHFLAKKAFLNAVIGGDVLVIQRYKDNVHNIQLVDGCHVKTPNGHSDHFPAKLANGNTIKNGIELSPTGEHVAYYVHTDIFKFERIPAKGSNSGLTMAFMVYGLEYRLDNVRGMPLISTVLETLKKLERYKEATVGSAEERQKIAYAIVHQHFSTGENPLAKNLARAYNFEANTDEIPVDVQGKALANVVAASTNKQVFNMPIGSELKSLESRNELMFKEFYNVNIDLVCAALGIPPEVAMSKYDSNFSASRAALKDWEHTIGVGRNSFSFMFYQPIYNFWLEVEILKNKIQAPGYLAAKKSDNDTVLEAYRTARFVGSNVPHIDPLKEVNAERAKLGLTGASIPLTTVEAATEALNGGESYANVQQYALELAESKRLGIVIEAKPIETPKQAN